MKTLKSITVIFVAMVAMLLLAACSNIRPAATAYDDIYYTPPSSANTWAYNAELEQLKQKPTRK